MALKMELIKFIAIIGCLASVCGSPLPTEQTKDEYIDANEYIDGIVRDIKHSDKLKRVPLPDYEISTNLSIWGVELYSMDVILNKGHTHDIPNIQRKGDAIVSYQNSNFDVEVNFFFESMVVEYDFAYLLYHHGPSGKLDVHMKDINIRTRLYADVSLANADLTKFEIHSHHPTDIKVHISWMVDWIVNPLVNRFYAGTILKLAETAIKTRINEYIDQFNGNSTSTFLSSFDVLY